MLVGAVFRPLSRLVKVKKSWFTQCTYVDVCKTHKNAISSTLFDDLDHNKSSIIII